MRIREAESNMNTEQQIMEVAEELFLSKGFAMTTTTEIARRVGCNQALVHYYFRTKDNLFEKLFEKKFTILTSAISSDSVKNCGLKEKVEAIIVTHLDVIIANPKLPFLIINELTTNPARFENIIGKLRESSLIILGNLEKELEIEIKKGNIRDISAFDLLLNILSLNIFMFLAKPLLLGVRNLTPTEFDSFVQKRRQEIIETVWGGICIKK